MKIQIIAEGSTRMDRRSHNWGLAILIDNDLLFDTFSNRDILKKNFTRYQVDREKIKHIVISHEHWDHTGGLWWILEQKNDVSVYVCSRSSVKFKNKIKTYGCNLVEVTGMAEIRENIFTTGEIAGSCHGQQVMEQSLILKNQDSYSIITGCSHPGILKILTYAWLSFRMNTIDLILGGLHLFQSPDDEIHGIVTVLDSIYHVQKMALCHCTGKKAVKHFRKKLQQRLLKVQAGDILDYNTGKSVWELPERER